VPDLTPITPATRAVWIRHGTSLDGLHHPGTHPRPDTPLSEPGRHAIQQTAHALRGWGALRVLTSPQRRARDSAHLLATALGIPSPEPMDVLREWRAPDCVIGLAAADYPQQYQHWRRWRTLTPDTALPGGESLTAFAHRAALARHQG
jgi:2,3-bisphosphoglycerate-dependent phosphoglycerate mutase